MFFHLAKEILALAVLELFPTAQLIGGEVDEIGFSYDFALPDKTLSLFGPKELELLEEKMRKIVYEKRPIKNLEMMRENASLYLEHLKQPILAEQALEYSKNILSIVQIGPFNDLCPEIEFVSTGDLKAFKLLKFEIPHAQILRISGTAFEDKKLLKDYLKKYKKACKTDPYRIGLEQNYFFYGPEQEWIYLPKAESLLWQFTNLWREWHVAQNFGLISIPQHLDRKEIQRVILQKKQLTKVASFDLEGGDIATSVSCPDKLLETLISSLQFFQQAFKIFPFEIGVCLDAKKSGTLAKALAHLGIQPSKETRNKETERVIWSSFDGFGRTVLLSSIEVEEKQGIVQHALFQSVKNWLALCIEHGVEKFEFESQ